MDAISVFWSLSVANRERFFKLWKTVENQEKRIDKVSRFLYNEFCVTVLRAHK